VSAKQPTALLKPSHDQRQRYPRLTKSYKGAFPFKLATTSFIYPDHYIPNVKMLGPYMDEIELLLFESRGIDALPSIAVIRELSRLAKEFDLTYDVHLPTDIAISDKDPGRRKRAVETIIEVMELVAPLCPSAQVLHLPFFEGSSGKKKVKIWQDRVRSSLEKILSVASAGDRIAVETLDYPFELVDDIIFDTDLKICLDLGHLIAHGFDIEKVFDKYAHKTAVIHLHGVDNGRDHISLDRLSTKFIEPVFRVLKQFNGVVSLEIFSFKNLKSSLKFLENGWRQRQG
jgi:sugar phosphate isomerase/epimerase